jgi:hypothetical protein
VWGTAQVVEHLPSNLEALSLKPWYYRQKKRNKEELYKLVVMISQIPFRTKDSLQQKVFNFSWDLP